MKEDVLKTAKDMLRKGLVEGTAGNISARMPDGSICITPSSVDYDAMTLEDLCLVDLDGEQIEGERGPSSEKLLHLAIYKAFDDVQSVIHSHPVYATMFAIARKPIPPCIDEFSIYVGGEVPVTEYGQSAAHHRPRGTLGPDRVGRHASRRHPPAPRQGQPGLRQHLQDHADDALTCMLCVWPDGMGNGDLAGRHARGEPAIACHPPPRSCRRCSLGTQQFGSRIRARREKLKLSQKALAHNAGVHRTYLASLESGRRNPSLETIVKLAVALKVDVAELVGVADHADEERFTQQRR